MSYAEFIDWMAYYQVEPFGGVRDDLRAAIVAATITNVNRDLKKNKPIPVSKFVPDFWPIKRSKKSSAAHAANLLAKFQMLTSQPTKEPTEKT